jgi:hypothetical protein
MHASTIRALAAQGGRQIKVGGRKKMPNEANHIPFNQ